MEEAGIGRFTYTCGYKHWDPGHVFGILFLAGTLTGDHVRLLRVDEVRSRRRCSGRCECGRGRCRVDRSGSRSWRCSRQSGGRRGQLLLLLYVELLLLLLLDELQLLGRCRGCCGRICCRHGRRRCLLRLMITKQLLNDSRKIEWVKVSMNDFMFLIIITKYIYNFFTPYQDQMSTEKNGHKVKKNVHKFIEPVMTSVY